MGSRGSFLVEFIFAIFVSFSVEKVLNKILVETSGVELFNLAKHLELIFIFLFYRYRWKEDLQFSRDRWDQEDRS